MSLVLADTLIGVVAALYLTIRLTINTLFTYFNYTSIIMDLILVIVRLLKKDINSLVVEAREALELVYYGVSTSSNNI